MIKLGIRQKTSLITFIVVTFLGLLGAIASYFYVNRLLVDQHTNDIRALIEQKNESLVNVISISEDLANTISESLFAKLLLTGKPVDVSYINPFNVSGKYLAIYITDAKGLTVASTDQQLVGQNYAFRKYFKEAMDSGRGSEVSIGVTTGKLGYYFAHRVEDASGKALGVVVVKTDPKQFDNALIDFQANVDANYMIVDEYGIVVSSPQEPDRLYKSLGKISASVVDKLQQDNRYAGKKIESLQYDQVLEVLNSSKRGSWVLQVNDVEDGDFETLMVYKIGDSKLYLVAEARFRRVFAASSRSAILVGGIILLISTITGLLTSMFLGRFLSPILKLKLMAREIAGGKLILQNDIRTKDEFEDLGDSLVALGGALYESYKNLEAKVRERTAKLESLQSDLANQLEEKKKQEQLLDLQNRKMNDTQKAIVNLLEDSREYERELKIQKEGTEKLVEERTAQLQEERSRLISSVEALVRGYALIGPNKEVILSNKAMNQILGSNQQIKTLEEIDKLLGDKIDLSKMYEQCLSGKQRIFVNEAQMGAKVISIFLSPVKRLGGDEVIGTLVLIDDITEKWALDRSKDEFFSIASHELRTPLTAIRGNASMIKDIILPRVKDNDLAEMINDIYEGSQRLITIVNDFLQVSRLEQGKMEFRKEPFVVNEIVDLVAQELKKTAEEKGLSLNINQVPYKLRVNGDKQKSIEVLTNLVGNAIKYTDKGVVEITVEDDKGLAVVKVKDTGRGVSLQSQGLLFRKFQQAGDNMLTRDTAKSTGLGLYISKMMAEGMGGNVRLIWSAEGQGSIFAFELPIV